MDVEQRARDFIASRTSNPEHRQDVLDGDYDDTVWFGHVAAALTPPEGYMLVPVELVTAIEDLALIYEAGGDIDRKLSQIEGLLAARPDHIAHDLKMVGASPEVKP